MLILLPELCRIVARPVAVGLTGLVAIAVAGELDPPLAMGDENARPKPSEKRHHELRTSSMLTLAKSIEDDRPDACRSRLAPHPAWALPWLSCEPWLSLPSEPDEKDESDSGRPAAA